MQPAMSEDERICFAAAVRDRRHIVEFGCGGSTHCALTNGAKRITSVESDPVWVKKLQDHADLAPAIKDGRLSLRAADIGPTGAYGRPKDPTTIERWPGYWRDVWDAIDPSGVDCVFIDGRFRVACTLNALLQSPPETVIIIHDFWNRPQYHGVLAYLTPALRQETLGVFAKKPDLDRAAVTADLLTFAFDPA